MPKARSKSLLSKADEYVAFIKTIHLRGLGMDEASFRIDRSALSDFSEVSAAPAALLSGKQEVVNFQDNSFSVRGRYNISIKGQAESNAVEISCTYSATFSLDSPAERSIIERFAENEARLVIWPHLRQFIADCTMRMSIPPLLLPLSSEIQALHR